MLVAVGSLWHIPQQLKDCLKAISILFIEGCLIVPLGRTSEIGYCSFKCTCHYWLRMTSCCCRAEAWQRLAEVLTIIVARKPIGSKRSIPNMGTQAMRLWELAGAESKRVFSPYVWRVRLVLAHKGINYESTTWRYSDKRLISPAQKVGPSIRFYGLQPKSTEAIRAKQVPVLDVGDLRLTESRDISQYIEDSHPEKPVFTTGCQVQCHALYSKLLFT